MLATKVVNQPLSRVENWVFFRCGMGINEKRIPCYSIFNIRELLLGHIILQSTYTQDGLIERPLLLPFVKKKCCT